MANNYRKLVTVQEINDIKPVENADRLEIATVLGWEVVVGKNEFTVGEKVIFFEVDSFLPVEDKYEFLRSRCYVKSPLLGEGFRIMTFKLRGKFSQGLIMKLEENYKDLAIGYDLTTEFNVRLFEKPDLGDSGYGEMKPYFHNIISKTDEIRLQTDPKFLDDLRGKPYYISEKIDGTSCTLVRQNNETKLYGRKTEYTRNENSLLWKLFDGFGLIKLFDNLDEDIFIQGELYGEGIQGNKLKITGKDFRAFNFGNPNTGELYSYNDWTNILERIDKDKVIKTVKILEDGECFNYNLDDLLKKASGNYENAGKREGIVIRPKIEEQREDLSRLSFKVLNNEFLLKNKD